MASLTLRGTLALALILLDAGGAFAASAKARSVSPRLAEAVDMGPASASERHHVVVGLDLRERADLEAFLAAVQDPASSRYGQFLTQDEFNARYAPDAAAEQAVIDHLRAAGLRVTSRSGNRLLVGATGTVAALERAFGVRIHGVMFGNGRHYAAIDEPSLPGAVAPLVVGVTGLDDLSERHSRLGQVEPAVAPRAALGTNCCHLSPNDLLALYDNGTTLPGTGETIVIAGAYAWKDTDNTAFNTQWALPSLPAGSGQVCTGPSGSPGCKFSVQNSIEIALDVEYAHGTAPGARILNYMSASTSLADFTTMYNRIVTDNPGHVVTTSWGACEASMSTGTQQTDDNIFANANAIGQSWFAASGDSGSRDCSNLLTVDNPANSPHVMGVGGTTPSCSAGLTPTTPACGGYGSEVGWSGSGGGVSQVFAHPSFQTGCGVPAGTTQRLVPDVALEADTSPGNYVVETGSWYLVGGTSGAAPQWAGLFAELGQQRGVGAGNPGALLYGLCGTPALHDVISGSNGDYAAGPGYDLVTGIGSFDARNLLAAAGGATTTTTAAPTTTTTSTAAPTTTTTTTLAPTTTTTTTLPPTTTSTTTTLAPTTTSSSTTTLAPTTTSTTTLAPTTTSSTTLAPTTTSTTTLAPTTTSSTTLAPTTSSTSTSSTTTTTLVSACLPSGAACGNNGDCCSAVCRRRGSGKVCR